MKRKLLVVDDRAEICAVISRIAETLGFSVASVTDPLEAVAAFAAFAPDLVILDMIMPRVDGPHVLREILRSGIATRFVLITGDGIGDAYLGIAQGVARYHGVGPLPVLLKPFRHADLVEVLERVPHPDNSNG